ncbi:MAG: ABC transporter permease subunit [Chitinophagales bacterium]|nr:ABC transporter permease subunit [Chitinophagales bacterium]
MKLTGKLLYGFVLFLFLVLAVAPLVFTFLSSFSNEGQFTFKNYEAVFQKDKLLLLWNSCVIAALIAAISTIIGGVIGWIISKTDVPLSTIFKLAFLLPLFVSPYYFAVAWKDVFSILGISGLQGKNGIVLFIHSLCYFPLPMLIIAAAFTNINRNIIEAGLMTASRVRVLFSLEVPLIKQAFFSSFILVFILSISEVAVATYFLVPTFASDIFIQFSAFYNHAGAIASSTLLLLICLALLAFEYSYFMKAPFLSIGTKGNPTNKIQLKTLRIPVMLALLAFWVVVILLPIFGLAYQAFKAPPEFSQVRQNIIETEGGGETGFYVKRALDLLLPVIPESLLYAAIGASVICILGFVFAYFAQRKSYHFFDAVLLVVFAIPATVFGIALIKFYNRPVLDSVYSSFLIIVIAYVGRFTFIASKVMSHAIGKVPFSLEQSAMLAGASPLQRIGKILFPLIAEGFFAAFIISFVFCLGEVGTTIVVYPPGSSLLPIKIATAMHSTPEGLMSGMVFVALMITLAALTLLFAGYSFISKNKSWKQA